MAGGRERSVVLWLGREPAHVGHARAWVCKLLPEWGLAERSDVVELVVSELVTNAVRYGEGVIELRVSLVSGDLWIEVGDAGGGLPIRRHATEQHTTGRGLELVDALLSDCGGVWGYANLTEGSGKTVFAALPTV